MKQTGTSRRAEIFQNNFETDIAHGACYRVRRMTIMA